MLSFVVAFVIGGLAMLGFTILLVLNKYKDGAIAGLTEKLLVATQKEAIITQNYGELRDAVLKLCERPYVVALTDQQAFAIAEEVSKHIQQIPAKSVKPN